MKKLFIILSIAIATMMCSSCIILRDVEDTSYTQQTTPNRPNGSNSGRSTTPNRPGSSDSYTNNNRNKPNRP